MVDARKCFRDNSYALRYVSLLLLLQKEQFIKRELDSIAFLYVQVSSVTLKDSDFFRKPAFFPLNPADLFEQPLFAKMGCDDSVLVIVVRGYEFVEKPEEFVNLLSGKIRVVVGVFHFKSIAV